MAPWLQDMFTILGESSHTLLKAPHLHLLLAPEISLCSLSLANVVKVLQICCEILCVSVGPMFLLGIGILSKSLEASTDSQLGPCGCRFLVEISVETSHSSSLISFLLVTGINGSPA